MKNAPIERSQEEDNTIDHLFGEASALEYETRGPSSRKLLEMRDRLYPREIKSLIQGSWWFNDAEFALLKATLKEKDPTWIDDNPGNNY